jgi:hypothetical protein
MRIQPFCAISQDNAARLATSVSLTIRSDGVPRIAFYTSSFVKSGATRRVSKNPWQIRSQRCWLIR